MLSKKAMNLIKWEPFKPILNNSLDKSMNDALAKFGIINHMAKDPRLIALSVSTPLWKNKHSFLHHWSNILPSEKIVDPISFLSTHFPEALTVHQNIYEKHSPRPDTENPSFTQPGAMQNMPL
jgi:hypothetical protein